MLKAYPFRGTTLIRPMTDDYHNYVVTMCWGTPVIVNTAVSQPKRYYEKDAKPRNRPLTNDNDVCLWASHPRRWEINGVDEFKVMFLSKVIVVSIKRCSKSKN